MGKPHRTTIPSHNELSKLPSKIKATLAHFHQVHQVIACVLSRSGATTVTGGRDLEQWLERGFGPDGYDGLLLDGVNVNCVQHR